MKTMTAKCLPLQQNHKYILYLTWFNIPWMRATTRAVRSPLSSTWSASENLNFKYKNYNKDG